MGNKNDDITVFVDGIRKGRSKEKEQIENILNNPYYMMGLVEKLRNNNYLLESRDEKEYYNTYNNLSLLYKIVDNYAKDNGLYSIAHKNYEIYYVEYHNYIFSIFAKKEKKEITYGCYPNYAKKDQIPYYIGFDDIKDNKVKDVNIYTRGLISELKDTIDKLYNEGFPIYFIQQLVNNIVEEKRNEEEENIYKK